MKKLFKNDWLLIILLYAGIYVFNTLTETPWLIKYAEIQNYL